MKKGFTLAETLVTLAIIGVIAGIMIPAVNHLRPNREMVMLKKAYTLLSNAVYELINDDYLYREVEDPEEPQNDLGFRNIEQVRFHGVDYNGETKFCGLLAAKLNTVCVNNAFRTSDGMEWAVPASNFSAPVTVTVDVNPQIADDCADADESINCAKPHIFTFIVESDGRIVINGHLAPQYIREHNNTKQVNEFN